MRRSSGTRFHKNGDKIPPWGHALLILIVFVASLWLMVIYLLATMLMMHWAVAKSSFVLWMASATAFNDTVGFGLLYYLLIFNFKT